MYFICVSFSIYEGNKLFIHYVIGFHFMTLSQFACYRVHDSILQGRNSCHFTSHSLTKDIP